MSRSNKSFSLYSPMIFQYRKIKIPTLLPYDLTVQENSHFFHQLLQCTKKIPSFYSPMILLFWKILSFFANFLSVQENSPFFPPIISSYRKIIFLITNDLTVQERYFTLYQVSDLEKANDRVKKCQSCEIKNF